MKLHSNSGFYTKLIMKCHIKNEIAFLFYNAVIDLHSSSYGNHEQKIKQKINEFGCDIL